MPIAMKRLSVILSFLAAVLMCACEKSSVLTGATTLEVTEISMTGATFVGNFVLPEQIANDLELGFEVSSTPDFGDGSTKLFSVTAYKNEATGLRSAEISKNELVVRASGEGLNPDSTYYVRAYMKNYDSVYYGNVIQFRTSGNS